MKHTVVVAFILMLAAAGYANPPFTASIHAVGYGDTMNIGETAMAMFGPSIYTISNTNERGTYECAPFGRSTDGGLTWLPTIGWHDPSVGISWHSDPAICTDAQGNVHMLMQFSTTVERHYLSTDGGNSWCESIDVSDRSTGGQVDKDWLVYDRGNLYVCFQEISGGSQQGIRFCKSTDNGYTWTRQTIVSTSSGGITTMCVDPAGTIYIAYDQGGTLYFLKSLNQGANWTTPSNLGSINYSTGYGDRASMPNICAPTDGVLMLAWTDNRNGNWDVLYRRSTDGGANWTAVTTLNDSVVGGQFKVWMTHDPYGGLHIMYYTTPSWPTSSSSRMSMRYRYSPDGGATLMPSIRVSDTTFTSMVTFMGEYHNLLCDSERVYIEWTDGRNGVNNEVYFARAELSELAAGEYPSPPQVAPVLAMPALFRGSAELSVALKLAGPVTLDVFDGSGRLVRNVHRGILPAGKTDFVLSSLPANRPLFLRLSGSVNATRKFVVLP